MRSEIFGALGAPWVCFCSFWGSLGVLGCSLGARFEFLISPVSFFPLMGLRQGGRGGGGTPSRHQNGQQGLPLSSFWTFLGALGCLWGYKICSTGPSTPTKPSRSPLAPLREPTDAPKSNDSQPKRYGLGTYSFPPINTTICPAGQNKLKPKSFNF